MKKHFRVFTAFLISIITLAACTPSAAPGGTEPASPDEVATVVSQTLQPNTTDVTDVPANLLPHRLYFLSKDNQSLTQVFRLEPDGKTKTQLTFEPVNVTDYDVSLADRSIAYVASNQLLLANADGSNRRVLIDGGSSPDLPGYYRPVFSPDGQTLAYSRNGLNLYSLASDASNLVLEDHPLGGSLPPETYVPYKFSPDGTRLLLQVGHPPDSPWTAAIHSLATNSLTQVVDDESLSCCTQYEGAEWTADSSSLYAVATLPDSSSPFGVLWKVDAATGAVTKLIQGSAGEGDTKMMYLPSQPYPAPDGQIYFFFAKYPESADYFRRVPLLLIRSTPEDIAANWTVLRPDTFELMNEALWAPDASFVIVLYAPSADVYQGGQAEIVYLDGRPNVLLENSAERMKWGP